MMIQQTPNQETPKNEKTTVTQINNTKLTINHHTEKLNHSICTVFILFLKHSNIRHLSISAT